MNDERNLLRTLLHVDPPWAVVDCRTDPQQRRFDVSLAIEAPRGWFGRPRSNHQLAAAPRSWRHVNFGDWQVHVHVAAPPTADLSRLSWAGDGELPFSRALSEQVFAFLREGSSLQSICSLLNLPITELWRFRYAVDSGRWGADKGAALTQPRQPDPIEPVDEPREAAPGAGVPALDDPVWDTLLRGTRQIDVRVLGLRLLLTRLRAQLELISDDEVRLLKLHELHRYFVKNRHLLAYELGQLHEQAGKS